MNSGVAVLRRDGETWHLESEGVPSARPHGPLVPPDIEAQLPPARDAASPTEVADVDAERWTGVPLGERGADGAWLLLLPGTTSAWRAAPWFESFVRHVSLALQLTAASDATRRAERLLRLVHLFTRQLGRTNPDRLHQLIVDTIAKAVGAEIGSLGIYQPEEAHLSISATHGYPAVIVQHVRVPSGAGVLGAVFASGKPLLVPDVTAIPWRQRTRYRTKSFMAVPLTAGDTTFGVVAVTDRTDGGSFSRRALVTARMLAAPAALALARESVTVQARQLARVTSIDPLTGLTNRREFQTRLDEELERARRYGLDLALLMIDIDGFKAVNDVHGHVAGDIALQSVAKVLQRSVRRFDVCARYGGDEFAVLTPGSDAERALQNAERIRRRLEFFQPESTARAEGLRLTASIGVATTRPGVSSVELVTMADRALYRAKADGRNCVRLAEATPGSPTD